MTRTFFALGALCALLGLSACSGDKENPYDYNTRIEANATSVSAESGSTFLSVTAQGDWTIELQFSDEGGWGSVDPASGSASLGNVRFRYTENTGASARTVTFILHPANGAEARCSVEQRAKGTTPPPQSYGSDLAQALWLELPATVEGDGKEWFVHDMSGGAYQNASRSGVRNWSFYWDYAEHLSQWVAYPLNARLRGSGERSNAWGLDPLLPSSLQPNLVNGSYGGGWTRGHQIPSADRLATAAANISTFYGTNMTPQDYDFNARIWASLEGKVRSYAQSADTLYVVTGCLYDQSRRWTGTNSGFAVRVPTHYFKALLYRGVSTYATQGFMAAGYLLPHDSSISDRDCLDYLMSIDELETQTGIDFFPNLASVIGQESADRIEAQTPSSWWK